MLKHNISTLYGLFAIFIWAWAPTIISMATKEGIDALFFMEPWDETRECQNDWIL